MLRVPDKLATNYKKEPMFHQYKNFCCPMFQADFGFSEHHQNEVVNYLRFARSKRLLQLKTIVSCFQELKDSR